MHEREDFEPGAADLRAERGSLVHPADELVAIMRRIYHYRMTTTSGGNVSIRDDEDTLWITPSQVDKGALKREDMVIIRADGTPEGLHKPSSEYPFHEHIYAARPDLRAIVHAHPVALVAFSICGKTPDTQVFHRCHEICGTVGFAPYALPGSEQLGRNIAGEFAKGFNCVVLENHGVVVGGTTLMDAFQRFETLEFTGRILLKAKALGMPIRRLGETQMELARISQVALPEIDPSPATVREKALRRELCEFAQRAYRQRLFTSAQGSYSARIAGGRFLITPTNVDRATVEVEDLVLIDSGRRELGKNPSLSTRLHQALYAAHPTIESIVLATPPNATAFTVTDHRFDARTIPESYVFLRDVHRFRYEEALGDGRRIAAAISSRSPAALIENTGALVSGRSILDAFDRLEVLESTADALINALGWRKVRPMSETVIKELTDAFLK